MDSLTVSLFRIRAVADADPGAVARVIERFQNINIQPRRVIAEFGINTLTVPRRRPWGMPLRLFCTVNRF